MDSSMISLRRIAAVILVTAMGAVVGSAASLSFASGSLGAATTATPRCTTAGLTVFQNLAACTVASVTVGARKSQDGDLMLLLVTRSPETGQCSRSPPDAQADSRCQGERGQHALNRAVTGPVVKMDVGRRQVAEQVERDPGVLGGPNFDTQQDARDD